MNNLMDKELIYIGSVNRAIKAREILKQHGIKSQVERVLNRQPSTGCGYSVLVVSGSKQVAEEILYNNGILRKSES